jgi:hypothetical protein
MGQRAQYFKQTTVLLNISGRDIGSPTAQMK